MSEEEHEMERKRLGLREREIAVREKAVEQSPTAYQLKCQETEAVKYKVAGSVAKWLIVGATIVAIGASYGIDILGIIKVLYGVA